MHPKDNGYLGGIIDGEGCISIMFVGHSKKVTTTALAISVYQADKRLMDWLIFHYGGRSYEQKYKPLGTRPGYIWFAPTGKSREKFLLLLIPHLLLKKEQALLALEYVRLSRSKDAREDRHELAKRCQELNRYVSNKETAERKSNELLAHQLDSYYGPRKGKKDPVTTNMRNDSIWREPNFTEISPKNRRFWRNLRSIKLKRESELHGDMQSAPGVIPDESLSTNDHDNLEYMASLKTSLAQTHL